MAELDDQLQALKDSQTAMRSSIENVQGDVVRLQSKIQELSDALANAGLTQEQKDALAAVVADAANLAATLKGVADITPEE